MPNFKGLLATKKKLVTLSILGDILDKVIAQIPCKSASNTVAELNDYVNADQGHP